MLAMLVTSEIGCSRFEGILPRIPADVLIFVESAPHLSGISEDHVPVGL